MLAHSNKGRQTGGEAKPQVCVEVAHAAVEAEARSGTGRRRPRPRRRGRDEPGDERADVAAEDAEAAGATEEGKANEVGGVTGKNSVKGFTATAGIWM